jgi:hypothetical protein
MLEPALPLYLLSQAVAVTFTYAMFFGVYLVTVCFENWWLFFTDEGWKLKRQIHWPLAIVTNLIWAFTIAIVGLSLNGTIVPAIFVEVGHPIKEFVSPGWDSLLRVCSSLRHIESGGELT